MHAYPHGQPHASFLLQSGIQWPHGVENAQARQTGALGIVFVCLGIAKVHQQAVAQILRNIPVKALDHRRRRSAGTPARCRASLPDRTAGPGGSSPPGRRQHRELPALGLRHSTFDGETSVWDALWEALTMELRLSVVLSLSLPTRPGSYRSRRAPGVGPQ